MHAPLQEQHSAFQSRVVESELIIPPEHATTIDYMIRGMCPDLSVGELFVNNKLPPEIVQAIPAHHLDNIRAYLFAVSLNQHVNNTEVYQSEPNLHEDRFSSQEEQKTRYHVRADDTIGTIDVKKLWDEQEKEKKRTAARKRMSKASYIPFSGINSQEKLRSPRGIGRHSKFENDKNKVPIVGML